jgi:hypothetical protein
MRIYGRILRGRCISAMCRLGGIQLSSRIALRLLDYMDDGMDQMEMPPIKDYLRDTNRTPTLSIGKTLAHLSKPLGIRRT